MKKRKINIIGGVCCKEVIKIGGLWNKKFRKLLLLYVNLLNPSSSSSLRFSFGLATQPISTRLRSPIAVLWTILKPTQPDGTLGHPSPLLNKAMSRPPSLAGLMLGMLISGVWVKQVEFVQQGAVMHNKFTNKLTESREVQSTLSFIYSRLLIHA